jgi:hypothetical protein
MNIWGVIKNNFSDAFKKYRDEEEVNREDQLRKNSQAISQEQMDAYNSAGSSLGMAADCNVTHVDFQPIINNKMYRIAKYREMYLYPEVGDAIDQITNDSIVADDFGDIIKLDIKPKDHSTVPKNIEKRIQSTFDYLVSDVFRFNETGDDYFKKFLVEGELYAEVVMDVKKKNIIGVRVLPAFSMIPIYNECNGIAEKYIQVINTALFKPTNMKSLAELRASGAIAREFEPEQIIYINYGDYGANRMDVRGFLEKAIRVYNQLKNIEDAIVVYRLVRAPERKVWNIYTGRLPKGKAEEYMQGLMRRYRKNNIYDPTTGAINSTLNIQAATEDFWFSKDENGNGTTVDTIGGAMNLGEIEDINYFLKKLYKALKFPSSRWAEPTSQYTGGRMGEVTREEMKLARFEEKMQSRFKYLILDPLRLLCRMRGIDEKYCGRGALDIQFTKSSYYKEYLAIDLLNNRFGMLGTASSYIWSPDNTQNGLFSKEFVMRKYFKMPDDEFDENDALLEIEKKKAKEEQAANAAEEQANAQQPNDQQPMQQMPGQEGQQEEPLDNDFSGQGGQ